MTQSLSPSGIHKQNYNPAWIFLAELSAATLFSDPFAIWFVFLAAFVGIVFGALPGLTIVAMMLPILIPTMKKLAALPAWHFCM